MRRIHATFTLSPEDATSFEEAMEQAIELKDTLALRFDELTFGVTKLEKIENIYSFPRSNFRFEFTILGTPKEKP